ncbi:MAG: PTS sugar transporter subunit IIA, partial [Treponema sp.]|nr:PTS sugar transporter subunit IIA [Treponema sp.]
MAEIREGLVEILKRGGVYSGVDGTTPREVLAALIKELPPMAIQTDKLLEAVLEREEIMSTGIGDGIALPHPRSPL